MSVRINFDTKINILDALPVSSLILSNYNIYFLLQFRMTRGARVGCSEWVACWIWCTCTITVLLKLKLNIVLMGSLTREAERGSRVANCALPERVSQLQKILCHFLSFGFFSPRRRFDRLHFYGGLYIHNTHTHIYKMTHTQTRKNISTSKLWRLCENS